MTLPRSMSLAEQEAALQYSQKQEAEIKALRQNFARYLTPAYLENPVEIARICDEEIDRTGKLLGYVREAAADARRSL